MTRTSRLLYHYTSADGLLGIIESASLWATDIRFLNDSAEFTFARDILLGELRKRADRLRHERARKIVRRELDHLARWTALAYVVSFSERGNALSQWRAYAPRDGVAIGFHRRALRAIDGFVLEKCCYADEYGGAAGRRNLHTLVGHIEDMIRWVSRLTQQEQRKTQTAAQRRDAEASHAFLIPHSFVGSALRLKHAGFAEEAEWRLINNDERPNSARYRRGTFGVTPYLMARLPERWKQDWPLGIAEVVVGPSPNARATVDSVRDLLKNRLGSPARVIECGIPYRS
jgi:hypothetical protein